MPPPRRIFHATVVDTMTPPCSLTEGQTIARVVKANGKNIYTVKLPSFETATVELEARFRSKIWLKRGSFVLIDRNTLADRDNKLDGEIINVVREEKEWRKEAYWPKEFVKKLAPPVEDDDEESTVGKMPPSDEEDSDA